MKEKRITKKPKILYHLSTENHDGEWFKPRVPLSIYKNPCGSNEHDEDDKIRRVCFSLDLDTIAYSGFYPKLKMYWMKRFN